MEPKEKIERDILGILKKIKELEFYTRKEEKVKFVFPHSFDTFRLNEFALEEKILYKLKELGALDLEHEPIPKDTLIYNITYLLTIHHTKFNKLYNKYQNTYCSNLKKEIKLKDKTIIKNFNITFDNKKAKFQIDNKEIKLPPYKDEHCFCKIMYKYKKNIPIDWSTIYDQIAGSPKKFHNEYLGDPIKTKKNKRKVYDTMRRVNNRIKKEIPTNNNLFTSRAQTIIRNF